MPSTLRFLSHLGNTVGARIVLDVQRPNLKIPEPLYDGRPGSHVWGDMTENERNEMMLDLRSFNSLTRKANCVICRSSKNVYEQRAEATRHRIGGLRLPCLSQKQEGRCCTCIRVPSPLSSGSTSHTFPSSLRVLKTKPQ